MAQRESPQILKSATYQPPSEHTHPFFTKKRGLLRVEYLRVGEALRTASGQGAWLVEVEHLQVSRRVFNLGVAHFRTYFVGEQGVWVHNCFEQVKHLLGTMSKEEFERHSSKWSKGTFDKLEDSLVYHVGKHGKDMDLAKYLRQASSFSKRGAKKTGFRNNGGSGSKKWTKPNGEFIIENGEGKIVSYGKGSK